MKGFWGNGGHSPLGIRHSSTVCLFLFCFYAQKEREQTLRRTRSPQRINAKLLIGSKRVLKAMTPRIFYFNPFFSILWWFVCFIYNKYNSMSNLMVSRWLVVVVHAKMEFDLTTDSF